ncbi:clavaminate synthase family protein [Kutzneria viridogrisea]|uniref:TauD/TfdA-like domain-containing protein n=2 Tax=Kutzneria TaxID=43356 RepID=W5WFJ2_9PSEU|nr:TauD/TfdA family dioxygenase [Kutzneria albida]AHH99520.1 hypothetical protein KALB_6160 [Kutzneria albida DSM 43870]MBA8922923.1 L-asparagine oxygenase [Kutzneria viridogrisea]
MSVVTETVVDPIAVVLDSTDAAGVEQVARSLCGPGADPVDSPDWVAAARQAWDETPIGLRRPLREFRRDSGPQGAMLLRGLPVDREVLPDTPGVAGSVQRTASVPAAVLMMIAAGLGDPAAFRPEKTGALVQDVVPVRGKESFQGNAGSVLLEWHTENAFHPNRPDFVMLLCLRQDHEGIAGLRTACIRTVLPLLSSSAREALFSNEFVTQAPPSFDLGPEGAVHHAVLTGAEEDPNLQVDLAATSPRTDRAAAALTELQERFNDAAQTLVLRPGDLAIVDNRVTVHGRTGFTPRYDGQDRWLQRTFVMTDLRRSRHQRPSDGYVLV